MLSGSALAGTTTTPDSLSEIDPFPQGLWTLETFATYGNQPWAREQLYSGTVGVDYYFWSNWCFGFDAKGLYGLQPVQNVTSYGGNFLLRTHLIVEPNWSFYTDFLPGLLESNHRIPPGGTDFNFTIETGVGFTAHLWDQTDLLTGFHYLHLSNARQEGGDRNPSLNAFEAYVGFLIKL
ncbi:MAG TPA: hypothetical protein VGG44_03645 [Tepidisphaeraceae bacterium]|jgi:hypothetical protein